MAGSRDIQKRLREAFTSESAEQVQNIVNGLIQLETTEDDSARATLIERIYRELHNLKGSARAVKVTSVERICHPLESIMFSVKVGDRVLEPALCDLILQAMNLVSESISGRADAATVEEMAQSLALRMDEDSSEEAVAIKGEPEQINSISIIPDSQTIAAAPKRSLIPELDEQEHKPQVLKLSATRLDQLFQKSEELLSVKSMAAQQASEMKSFEVSLSDWAKYWATMVPELKSACRIVDRSKELDRAMISKTLNRLNSFIEESHEVLRNSALRAAGLAKDTNSYAHVAASALDLLMDETRQLLMMPCSSLFDTFPFLVRDLARQLKKEVEFTISNSEVELDKRILQSIRDPLVHILRNSIDHGIESPETRISRGKPQRGHIDLSVVQTDPKNIRITVRDDGRGIDTEKVKQSAIKAGLHSAEELELMSEEKLMTLTFRSSLSTSDTITEISGRGIGMAIVEENISNIGGKIQLESQLGKGTTVTILLPVTIATFRGLLVEASSRLYALPTTSVERVVRVTNDEIKLLTGALLVDLDGLLVPVCRLEDVLGEKVAPGETGSGYHTVCILSSGENRIGVIVDDVQEEQEILVKPLGKVLSGIPNVSGLTILGSGQVVPVLNSMDLINFKPPMVAGIETLPKTEQKKTDTVSQEILVVDDTLTARLLLTNLLETAGYRVDSARDAQEALNKLNSKKYCLVLTDVEMPKMNGFELTEAIRMRPDISKMPVIVVTSRATNEYRERGVKAGADAFFVKGNLKDAGLLQMVESLI